MASGKRHSCATYLAKVVLLISGSQEMQLDGTETCLICVATSEGLLFAYWWERDVGLQQRRWQPWWLLVILLQEPVQVVGYRCCAHLIHFCGHFPVQSTELCRLCQSSCLMQLAADDTEVPWEIGICFSLQNCSSFSFLASATTCLNKQLFFLCRLCPFFCWR